MPDIDGYKVKVIPWSTSEGMAYIAYLPAFGMIECSASGDDEALAINELKYIYEDVYSYYKYTGKALPKRDV